MTDAEALDLAVRLTGVKHYRHLCSEANAHPPPNDPATWRKFMHTVATRPWPPPPAVFPDRPSAPEAVALVRRMHACQFWSRDAGCGCSGGRCGLRHGEAVNHVQCFACLEKYDPLKS